MPKPTRFAARGVLGALSLLALTAAPIGAVDVSGQPESASIPFTQRYQAVQRGGVVRTANSSITCTAPNSENAPSCSAARSGGPGANGDFEMYYIDEDDDLNTYNSSRAELVLPRGAKVSYARLYWGGNLLAGEQKPAEDNGRVLIAEEGGSYKQVLADTRIAHHAAGGIDAFQASADITPLVREAGSGLYTVAQINVAMGHSVAGAWGGWTLVVAYENSAEPLRQISVWDGFETIDTARKNHEITLDGLRIPERAGGRAGFVAYDGDRGRTGDTLTVRAGAGEREHTEFGLTDSANPADDIMNSTITGPGKAALTRKPAHTNTLGYDSDVFDIGPALAPGGTRATFRFTAESRSYSVGVLFVQADTRR
ncbi:DUF3344 domain-containing protein [Streptomyces yaizuensis]|uniref:DUF3344 domain-containing protein n=1 Tax=Streptomyces yaizuensis TaxID=2989713 RepID=A0ABQ5NW12_9ACTN|nr:DUF3344 domain-containing protein [Streptomyces sp. YSPA8]GLF94343.1 DUF3344 domain-containing protein [Streptomyces sp. YSPA8]